MASFKKLASKKSDNDERHAGVFTDDTKMKDYIGGSRGRRPATVKDEPDFKEIKKFGRVRKAEDEHKRDVDRTISKHKDRLERSRAAKRQGLTE